MKKDWARRQSWLLVIYGKITQFRKSGELNKKTQIEHLIYFNSQTDCINDRLDLGYVLFAYLCFLINLRHKETYLLKLHGGKSLVLIMSDRNRTRQAHN